MFGDLDKILGKLGDKIAAATIEGIEKGAEVLGKAITEKMDELHERDRKRNEK